MPTPAPADLTTTGDATFAIPWTFLGLPTITLPIGLSEQRLPLAIQLAAPADADTRLLAEQALDAQLPMPDKIGC